MSVDTAPALRTLAFSGLSICVLQEKAGASWQPAARHVSETAAPMGARTGDSGEISILRA